MFIKKDEVIANAWEKAFRSFILEDKNNDDTLKKIITIICDFELSIGM